MHAEVLRRELPTPAKATREIAKSGGSLFAAWTLLALSVMAIFTCVLAMQGLWRLRRGA